MKTLVGSLLALAVLGVGAVWAQAPQASPSAPATGAEPQATPPSAPPSAPPAQAAPSQLPAPPAQGTAQAPGEEESTQEPPPTPSGIPSGQWVYTNQYGWIWAPYAQSYTYVPESGDPMMFVYSTLGWRWVAAPWVFGWGPRPYWGRFGVGHFAWYAHPWFHAGEFRGHPGAHRYGTEHRGAGGSGAHEGHPQGHEGHEGGHH